MIIESSNTVIKHLVNRLRDTNTFSFEFRTLVEEISRALVQESFSEYKTITKSVNTWQGELEIELVDEKSLVFIPILRAGEPMLTGALKILSNSRSGFVAMKRDEVTAEPLLFYENIPNLQGRTAIILDPMVATGGSLIDTISLVKKRDPEKIVCLNILGSKKGVEVLNDKYPDIPVYIAQIDPTLDANNYIIPGLGDAGDRAFYTHE